jgi:hypothetical protein
MQHHLLFAALRTVEEGAARLFERGGSLAAFSCSA